jgi:gamma-glutamylcyclotransferase (GGCT)/AIG2-like uncharacterized protein YtfP
VQHVFVYGSLRRGGSAEHLLAGSVRGPARLDGYALYGRTMPYPFVVPDPESSVVGEIVTLARDSLLGVLDEYEGDEYRRGLLRVDAAGREVPAWVWVAARPQSLPSRERIPSGDWFAR